MAKERDFPIGHPAAADYAGERYVPAGPAFPEDFPPGHPARDGDNTAENDTPDGMRAALDQQQQDLDELATIGAFPVDREHEADRIHPDGSPDEKAVAFLIEHGYTLGAASGLVDRVGSRRILASGASAKE
jgi:hypothetical protein